MKKMILALALIVAFSSPVFAGSIKPPATNTFNGCIQRPYTECSQYGNPWVPTWPTQKCVWKSGQGVVCVPNSPQPDDFIPYDQENWMACANEIYDECRCTYRTDLVKYNKDQDCSRF